MFYKNIIIGAGPTGLTLAEHLGKEQSTLIIERRNHIGGNCYDYYDKNGILIHKYGPHIFHTNYKDVWDYITQFTEFTNYQHRVVGFVDSQLISIPFNLNSLYKVFSPDMALTIEKALLSNFSYGQKVSIIELREKAEEIKELGIIADYIFEKVFKNYTIKQWGIDPKDIDENVLKRVPIMINRDDRYFPHHNWQGMPKDGYTTMFNKMLEGKNVHIMLNTNYKDVLKNYTCDKLFVTGPIDEYFDFKYGKLEYKKTLYKNEEYDKQSFQENVVVNYPNDYEYTRITEYKKFYPESSTYNNSKTVICKEIPGIGDIEAYPVVTKESNKQLEQYQEEAKKLSNVHFLGRLAQYKYIDMDQTFKNALDFIKTL